MSDLDKLPITEMDKDLSDEQRKEWNSIYASYRSASVLTGKVVGIDVIKVYTRDEKTGQKVENKVYCLVVIDYRVKVLIPESEIWYDDPKPSHVLNSMAGAIVDYVITNVDREGECCTASRRMALEIRRNQFRRRPKKVGIKVPINIIAVGRDKMLASMSGYDINIKPKDLTYAMMPDLRDFYHTGTTVTALVKEFNQEADTVKVSVKEAEPHPFDGAEQRHPLYCRRATVITGKYKGGVFCKLEDKLDCLCIYSPSQYDVDFHIGDQVIVVITKFNYDKKQVYGKIVAKW